jgi:spore coat polysaccharide biosynthesis predicted glycosyltransferase SpsG
MSFSLSIFTEASSQIGTGHLIESFNIAKLALSEDIKVKLWINDSAPKSLLSKSPCLYHFFDSITAENGKAIKDSLIREECKAIVFNFRRVNNEHILFLKHDNLKTICIDELGNQNIDCNIIINPSIVEKYHRYSSKNCDFNIYTGPEYLAISSELAKLHHKERIFKNEIETVSVCMGGVDRTGITLKLINTLAECNRDVKKNIILGGGFLYLDEVYKRIESLKDKGFRVYHNIENIESLFFESDVVFTAGGNTLYELACIGTPAIVLYEDEHEKENGMAFENLGFGLCLGQGIDVKKNEILNALEKFKEGKVKHTHSLKGKETVDGKGAYRILDIIKNLI